MTASSSTHRRKPQRLQSAREVALQALCRIEQDEAYANLVLNGLLRQSQLDTRDRAFATELTYGTVRWQGQLDWVLSHFVSRPLASQHPVVRNALRLAAYQLIHLRSIPEHAVCSEAVRIVKQHRATQHAAGFVNAVCRAVARGWNALEAPDWHTDPVQHLAVTTSHPAWLIERWIRQYGADHAAAYARSNNEPAPIVLRTNRLRCTVDELIGSLKDEGVEVAPSPVLPDAVRIKGGGGVEQLQAFQQGLCTPQDESSQLVAIVIDPKPGQRVWDVCSAPGGKTTHLAERMGDYGTIYALDVNPARVRLVEQACRRLGIQSVKAFVGDARHVQGAPGEAVLVDAPCSGSGVLRRRPDLRWARSEADFASLVTLQREILAAAAKLVQPGGVLLYSTCSVDDEENGQNVDWFLTHHPDFRPDPFYDRLPESLQSTITDRQKRQIQHGRLQLWPHLNDTDGFFVARLIRL